MLYSRLKNICPLLSIWKIRAESSWERQKHQSRKSSWSVNRSRTSCQQITIRSSNGLHWSRSQIRSKTCYWREKSRHQGLLYWAYSIRRCNWQYENRQRRNFRPSYVSIQIWFQRISPQESQQFKIRIGSRSRDWKYLIIAMVCR